MLEKMQKETEIIKTVKVIDGQVMICEVIKPNTEETVEECSIKLDILYCATAVRNRMTRCIDKLEKAYREKKVYATTEHQIKYIGGCFNIPSYNDMEELATQLEKDAVILETAPIRFFEKFRPLQLDQLKKAIVEEEGKWTSEVSAIEELFHVKWQKEMLGK